MPIFSKAVQAGSQRASNAGALLTTWQYDEPTNNIVVGRFQDVEPILEHNKRLATMDDGYSPSRNLRRVASIPMIVVEQWMQEGISIFNKNHRDAIRKKLNDPENLFLRTAPGRL